MKKAIFGFNVHDIAEIGILSAIAILLDQFVKIPLGTTGGSINICMIPLFIIALRHGWFKAFISGGIIFGFISCMIDGYGIQTYPLEYFVSFGSIAILGLFSRYIHLNYVKKTPKNIFLAYLILIGCMITCSIIRFFASSIDSVILYEYDWISALIYNLGYIFISSGVCVVLICLLYPTIKIINTRFKSSYLTYIENN